MRGTLALGFANAKTEVAFGAMLRFVALLTLFPLVALARPWQGLTPGTATEKDVVAKFGAPTQRASRDGRDVIAYSGAQAIKGTTVAQFSIDPATHTVQRIDVFPAAVIDKDTVESVYGARCPEKTDGTGCYVKRVTERMTFYFVYRDGLAVFFDDSGWRVKNFTFTPAR